MSNIKEKKHDEIENGMRAEKEMPKYRSHKTVWALKIKKIDWDCDKAIEEDRDSDGTAIITPEEHGYAPFKVDREYCSKHHPKEGGYYVVYKDGYKSWSPADAFEKGNTKIHKKAEEYQEKFREDSIMAYGALHTITEHVIITDFSRFEDTFEITYVGKDKKEHTKSSVHLSTLLKEIAVEILT